ncbi:hypothetical protein BVC80_1175g32 [Macleaya cordata]|uniref:Uncharacterized protein n=1 Tax=Macleaya cordata TaxID=56857 RepID=A0A200QIM4_MACCD|nr:hypothetical protein BVC80_1175g32 [Macleaya cordata]
MTSLVYNFFPTDLLPPNNIHFPSDNINGDNKMTTSTSQQPPSVLLVAQRPTQQIKGDQAIRSIKLDEHALQQQHTKPLVLRNKKKKMIQHAKPLSSFNSTHPFGTDK